MNSVCTKVFQTFPEFVQRCKNEAFEALSDPMYSGKMKVKHRFLVVFESSSKDISVLGNTFFLLGFAEAAEILST